MVIEVATNLVAPRGVVPVRDSKNPAGPTLDLRAGAFVSFVAAIERGDLDTV